MTTLDGRLRSSPARPTSPSWAMSRLSPQSWRDLSGIGATDFVAIHTGTDKHRARTLEHLASLDSLDTSEDS